MNEQDIAASTPGGIATQASTADEADQPVAPVRAKLADASIPGFQAEFDPDEAEAAGAFQEDALSEADALDSTHDGAPEAELAQRQRVYPLFRRN